MPDDLNKKRHSEALSYCLMGFHVIPVGDNKRPLEDWTQWQKTKPSAKQINQWWKKYPGANVAILTEGLAVVDCDTKEAVDSFLKILPPEPPVPCEETPRGGRHFFFSQTPAKQIRNSTKILPGVDIRGSGGYVVVSPSVVMIEDKKHPRCGEYVEYRWLTSILDGVKIPEIPDSIYTLYTSRGAGAFGGWVSPGGSGDLSTEAPREAEGEVVNEGSALGLGFTNKDSLRGGDYKGGGRNLSPEPGLLDDGRRDSDLFHYAWKLAKSGVPFEEAADLVCKMGQACNPPFPQRECMKKVESAYNRDERRSGITQAVKEWVEMSSGWFTLQEISRDIIMTLVTNRGQIGDRGKTTETNGTRVTEVTTVTAVKKALSRMVEAGVLVRHKDQNGKFKKVENTLNEINLEVNVDLLPVQYPLGLHELVNTMPKNIIVVAGVPDAGKTAYLMNMALLNKDLPFTSHRYFSSEMGAMELRSRVNHFQAPFNDPAAWSPVKFFERSENFAEVIDPNGINYIDFLEITDNFYLVAQFLFDIHKMLDRGVAVVAIQKDPAKKYGRGGNLGLEKARLYLTINRGVIGIEKAKNWKDVQFNPNGLIREFSLVGGCKFITHEGWVRAEEEK